MRMVDMDSEERAARFEGRPSGLLVLAYPQYS
jgi:hypothetical protein